MSATNYNLRFTANAHTAHCGSWSAYLDWLHSTRNHRESAVSALRSLVHARERIRQRSDLGEARRVSELDPSLSLTGVFADDGGSSGRTWTAAAWKCFGGCFSRGTRWIKSRYGDCGRWESEATDVAEIAVGDRALAEEWFDGC